MITRNAATAAGPRRPPHRRGGQVDRAHHPDPAVLGGARPDRPSSYRGQGRAALLADRHGPGDADPGSPGAAGLLAGRGPGRPRHRGDRRPRPGPVRVPLGRSVARARARRSCSTRPSRPTTSSWPPGRHPGPDRCVPGRAGGQGRPVAGGPSASSTKVRSTDSPKHDRTPTRQENDSMSDAMRAETVMITGDGGDEIEAYLAQPLDGPPTGGVVVIHHMPGYDEADQGDHPEVRRPRLPGHLPQPLLPGGPGGQPRRRRRHGPGPGRGARRAPGRRRRRRRWPTCGRSVSPTARWPPSATAPAAASRSWPPAASTSMPPSTATAPSSWPPPPEGLPAQGRAHRPSGPGPVVSAARAVRGRGPVPVARPRWPSSRRSLTDAGKTSSSTPTRGPATPSSPPTGPATGPRRPTRAGSGSGSSSAAT